MMTPEQAKCVVASRGWLSQTPAGFRDAVLARLSLPSCLSGETIYSINDPPGGMYGLVAGSAELGGEGLIETGYSVIGIREPAALRARLARDI